MGKRNLYLSLGIITVVFCCLLILFCCLSASAKAQGSKTELSFIADLFDDVSPSVVFISNLLEDDGSDIVQMGSGSGVICSEQGYIITNYHVVADAAALEVHLLDGRKAEAEVVAESRESDLALLKIDLDQLAPADLGDSDDVRVGDVVFPIGNPGGEQFSRSMTMGIISGIDRQLILEDGCLSSLLQTDAAINPGNSGGPLVNSNGEIIGINSIKIVDAEFEGMGFAVPANTVVEVLSPLCPDAFENISRN